MPGRKNCGHKLRKWGGVAVVSVATGSVALVGLPAATAGAASSKSPITIGIMADVTGAEASIGSAVPPAIEARFDLVNAQGGIDGHKIQFKVADTATSPVSAENGAKALVETDHVNAVVAESEVFFAAAPTFQQAGTPVAGFGYDGPEWGQQPNNNLFSVSAPSGPWNNTYYDYDSVMAEFYKSIGVTKLAQLGYNFAASNVGVQEEIAVDKQYGISECYTNTNVPLGGSDFTADALQIKSAGCNGVSALLSPISVYALSSALKDAGFKGKQLSSGGYDSSIFGSSATLSAAEGMYFTNADIVSELTPNAAVKSMDNALKKYDPSYTGGIPNVEMVWGYEAADLMVQGLEAAKGNVSSSSIISHLRSIKNFDASGLMPYTLSFAHFASEAMTPPKECETYVYLKGHTFVPADGGKLICGNRVAYTGPSGS